MFVDEILASLGGFALGISLGWNSKASIVLRNYVDASATEIGLIGGILNGGICIGAILIPFIVGRISRTNILFWTMPVLILTWTLMISNRRQKVRITFKSMQQALKVLRIKTKYCFFLTFGNKISNWSFDSEPFEKGFWILFLFFFSFFKKYHRIITLNHFYVINWDNSLSVAQLKNNCTRIRNIILNI